MIQGHLTYHVALGNKAEMKCLHNPLQITVILRHLLLWCLPFQSRLLLCMHRDAIRLICTLRFVAHNAGDFWFILKCKMPALLILFDYASSPIFPRTKRVAENYIFILNHYTVINTSLNVSALGSVATDSTRQPCIYGDGFTFAHRRARSHF